MNDDNYNGINNNNNDNIGENGKKKSLPMKVSDDMSPLILKRSNRISYGKELETLLTTKKRMKRNRIYHFFLLFLFLICFIIILVFLLLTYRCVRYECWKNFVHTQPSTTAQTRNDIDKLSDRSSSRQTEELFYNTLVRKSKQRLKNNSKDVCYHLYKVYTKFNNIIGNMNTTIEFRRNNVNFFKLLGEKGNNIYSTCIPPKLAMKKSSFFRIPFNLTNWDVMKKFYESSPHHFDPSNLSLRLDIKNIKPTHYRLHLTIDPVTATYFGNVNITINVANDADPKSLSSIFIHRWSKLNVDLNRIWIYENGNVSNPISIKDKFFLEESYDFIVLDLGFTSLRPGLNYTLRIDNFGSYMNVNDLRGLYLSKYTDEKNKTNFIASSQLQPIAARRVFPCFDEPTAKAIFTFSTTHRKRFVALSNMPVANRQITSKPKFLFTPLQWNGYHFQPHPKWNGLNIVGEEDEEWQTTDYDPTPLMSTYILAWVVGDLVATEANGWDKPIIRVWSIPNHKLQHGVAINYIKMCYRFFQTFFDLKEVIPKTDHVAVPDFQAGAMENWGLVIYRSTNLLYNNDVPNESSLFHIFMVIAHEVSHSWFGNLVTLDWWNDLWLNEAFASILMYFPMAQVYPEWKVNDLQLVKDVMNVMDLDALPTSHAISTKISNPKHIQMYFDAISYDKGNSIMRMLRAIMGREAFQLALRKYIADNQYKNAGMDKLWATLNEFSTVNIAEVMNSWILQKGYPYVHVKHVEGNKFQLNQQYFLLTANKTFNANESVYKYKWYIPFQYALINKRRQKDKRIWMNLKNETLIIPQYNHINSSNIIVGNVHRSGYYRVQYDLIMWSRITSLLKRNPQIFESSERAGLLDDAFNFASAGMLPYQFVLDLACYIRDERIYAPLKTFEIEILSIAAKINSKKCFNDIEIFIADVMKSTFDHYHTAIFKVLLLQERWAKNTVGSLIGLHAKGNSTNIIIKDARKILRNYLTKNQWPQQASAEIMFCIGIQHGTPGDWMNLWKKSRNVGPVEQVTLMRALAFSKDKKLLMRYLNWTLDPKIIPIGDIRKIFSHFAMGSSESKEVALEFLFSQFDDIYEKLGTNLFLLGAIIESTCIRISDVKTKDKITKMLNEKYKGVSFGSASNAIAYVFDRIDANIYWRTKYEKPICDWMHNYSLVIRN
ncbi:hypothetical protein SNEBB_004923 [Seison nebaliae]|nr:hypothetical protein SNEBB_004923 [Seison nebaliae]